MSGVNLALWRCDHPEHGNDDGYETASSWGLGKRLDFTGKLEAEGWERWQVYDPNSKKKVWRHVCPEHEAEWWPEGRPDL